jgi:hypothetical protein
MAVACQHGPVVEYTDKPEEKEAEVTSPGAFVEELEAAKAEAERLRGELAATEVKLHAIVEILYEMV